MPINSALIAEFKHESNNTKKILECVPENKLMWKPHEKSMSLGRLATHIADIPIWIERIINNNEFDFATAKIIRETKAHTKEILLLFDERKCAAIKALEFATDENLNAIYAMKRSEQVLYNLPRKVHIRNFAFNHLYHHRGQLSVFLRLLNINVPGMYGPSADEISMFANKASSQL